MIDWVIDLTSEIRRCRVSDLLSFHLVDLTEFLYYDMMECRESSIYE